MKKIILSVMLALTTSVFAQKPIELPLWPNGAPNSNELKGEEQEPEKNRLSNVTSPTITVYPAKNGNGKAIIMCPGGGYARLAMDHEGHDMASWFNAQGITYVVLKYRMPNGHSEVPISDAREAIIIVRKHAAEWGVNVHKVGIMGASAGGHLASTLATHFNVETRPDFQILLYPVITMNKSYTHGGSRQNLIGKSPVKELETLYSNELQVTEKTPKAFIALSSDDSTVPPQNSVNYYLALLKNKVSATMHIYPIGGHGWGFRDSFTYKRQWTDELEKWLREF
ncbi:alpha/beta hydrolase [uncultured Bacteroides sp.]|uniref:alpha/beta hydrolase n=1 Tax=uncultured Bacteroides sp. TaxID=162156 RepID=UPI002AA8E273|nr:alpha/beta hydrolase [uncultured Bacteroides sp.]